MEDIKVSVYCLAYNHEKYIKSALDGMVNQETNFRYEIIVHDDASKDNTAKIIKEYADKYPDIIKPIYQIENQYSKKIGIVKKYILPNIEGKYIAICEGDDYWIDNKKLQKQYDYLEKHPDCTFCFTNGYIEDLSNNSVKRNFIPYSKKDEVFWKNKSKKYTLKNIYEISFIPTASIMYPKKNLTLFPEEYLKRCAVSDLKLRLYSTALGYAYLINDFTCVYRENVPNSAMSKWKKDSKMVEYNRSKNIVDMIDDVDKFTHMKYTDKLNNIKYTHIVAIIKNLPNLKLLKKSPYNQVFKGLNLMMKIKIVLRIMLPQKILDVIRRYKEYYE